VGGGICGLGKVRPEMAGVASGCRAYSTGQGCGNLTVDWSEAANHVTLTHIVRQPNRQPNTGSYPARCCCGQEGVPGPGQARQRPQRLKRRSAARLVVGLGWLVWASKAVRRDAGRMKPCTFFLLRFFIDWSKAPEAITFERHGARPCTSLHSFSWSAPRSTSLSGD
jgi:hypothetical protein